MSKANTEDQGFDTTIARDCFYELSPSTCFILHRTFLKTNKKTQGKYNIKQDKGQDALCNTKTEIKNIGNYAKLKLILCKTKTATTMVLYFLSQNASRNSHNKHA